MRDPDDPPYETRPRASRGDDVPLLGNDELARIFYEIGDMLEIQGELPFKVGAYRRAADSIAHSPLDVARGYRDGTPPRLPGVGKAIDEKLAELADTGRLRYYERLRQDVPPSVVTLLQVPGLGPRTAGDLWRQAGIASLEELEAAARGGRLRTLKGMSAKTEQRLLDGARRRSARGPPRRMHLGSAQEIVDRVTRALETLPGVGAVVAAGSYRRRRETIADIDLLVETDQPGGGDRAAARARRGSSASAVTGRRTGGQTRTTVQLLRGPQVDVMTMPAGLRGHVPGPLHRLGRAQRPPAGDGARPGLDAVRARLHRRSSTKRERRSRSPPRTRCTRSWACRSSSPSCARIAARSRRRSPASCRRWCTRGPVRATATPTPSGRTGTWPIESMAAEATQRAACAGRC